MIWQKPKKEWYKRWWAITIFVLIGLSIGGSLVPDDNSSPTDIPTQTNTQQPNEEITQTQQEDSEPEETLTKEEKIKKDITDILESSNRDVEKIREISIIERADENLLVTVRYNADDNLGNSWIKRGIWIDSEKILEKVYTDYSDIGRVAIFAYFPLVDKYGNSEDEVVMKVMLDKETSDKINWENFITDNLPDVVDDYYAHPAINE